MTPRLKKWLTAGLWVYSIVVLLICLWVCGPEIAAAWRASLGPPVNEVALGTLCGVLATLIYLVVLCWLVLVRREHEPPKDV